MYALPLSAVWLCTCVRCYVSAEGHGVYVFVFFGVVKNKWAKINSIQILIPC